MAGSDAAEKLGPVPRGPVQAKQRELYSADEEEQGRAPQPCSELDGTWVGRAGCAQGQPERLAAGRGFCRLPGRGSWACSALPNSDLTRESLLLFYE